MRRIKRHHPRKRFGQHFLTDESVLMQIVDTIHAQPQDSLIEIGPGQGALTRYLLAQVNRLEAIEIDRDLSAYLQQTYPRLQIYNADVLKFSLDQLQSLKPWRIVGNLPYNITTPLLFKLFSYGAQIQDMHFLLQKEVVDRLTAPAGSSDYSRLTVMAQYYAELTALFSVDREAFSPPPQVESALVRIVPFALLPYPAQDINLFSQVVQEAFSYRRKTIVNSLRKLITADTLKSLNIDPQSRPQQLTVENFVKISNILTRSSQRK